MPLKWIANLSPAPEAPKMILAAPGSVGPRRRLTKVLAAGSLLVVAARPWPGPLPGAAHLAPASPFTVTNLNPSGPGSLLQAVQDANANPGSDTIAFSAGLHGTIALTTTLQVTDTVDIQGPGPGKLSVSGGNIRRVFYLGAPAQTAHFVVSISGLTVRDGQYSGFNGGGGIRDSLADLTLDQVDVISNTAPGDRGGGISFVSNDDTQLDASLTIRNSLISGNAARYGGGLEVHYVSGAVTISNTTFLSNSAESQGGGAFFYMDNGDITLEDSSILSNTLSPGGGHRGGGLSLEKSNGGQTTIRRTTIANNSAGVGAGLYLDLWGTSPVVFENSTISGNHASFAGGGMRLYKSDDVTIRNSTIVSNSATNEGGGVDAVDHIPLIENSIVAGNSSFVGPDLHGTFGLLYDLVQLTNTAIISDSGGNLFGLDPLLGPLADHGGATKTHLPLRHSPVINAGQPNFVPPPTTDQRGQPRVLEGRLDMGAAESEPDLFLPLVRR